MHSQCNADFAGGCTFVIFVNVFKELEGFAEKLDEDFYLKGRILSQEEFWKTELKYFQSLKSETESQGDPVRFVAELITRYLK